MDQQLAGWLVDLWAAQSVYLRVDQKADQMVEMKGMTSDGPSVALRAD